MNNQLPTQSQADADNRTWEQALPQMPLAIQADLVDQLHRTIKTSTSNIDKRSSLFDLAMCHLSGAGTDKVDIPQSLSLLAEAAQLGSSKALALVFRLHEALVGEVPPTLWEINHPIKTLEQSLSELDSRVYFAERLRRYEKVQQAEALKGTFDIRQNGETILRGVHLQDAHTKLKDAKGWCAEDLECVLCLEKDDSDMPQIQGSLLVTAARLSLLPLMEFLSAHSAVPSSAGTLTGHCPKGRIPRGVKMCSPLPAAAGTSTCSDGFSAKESHSCPPATRGPHHCTGLGPSSPRRPAWPSSFCSPRQEAGNAC